VSSILPLPPRDTGMHIPDGYLSPSTCAVLYALAASGWYAALRRVKRAFLTRVIPLISVFAAFSFVVMMFNVPLPGGTTGHAVGVTVATIVLGPWGSILAVSLALTIQALFFGDGGITTLGANCFNMAIVGSFAAYGAYRLLTARSATGSRRKVWAAAVAGYLAINVSALVAAVEFGIQPSLFHDASGSPLYAPYPLHIAIPAMMIGHLTFAGLAEAAISAGLIAYLQKADPSLLRGSARLAPGIAGATVIPVGHPPERRLWLTVAVLMVCTPLGVLAVGSAWGEWSAADFSNPATRASMAQASGNQAPPAAVPGGLHRLSTLWTAPFPGYAPRFIRSAGFGYLLSAMFGVGVLAVVALLAQIAGRRKGRTPLL